MQHCKQLWKKIKSILKSFQCRYLLPNAGVAAITAPGTVPNVKPAAEKQATVTAAHPA